MSRPLDRSLVWAFALCVASPASAQDTGREAALALSYEPLQFNPSQGDEYSLSNGVSVLHLEDRSLPLVTVSARFRGGSSHFPRAYYAAASALPVLIRSGGTRSLPPDSLDVLLERYAISTSVGTGGESSFATMNSLTRHLDIGLELLADMLRRPSFDSARVEVWRGQELESVRRRTDDPSRLAFSEFNRLLFGDHPIGWEMEPADLEPEDLARERLEWLHRRIFCPDNLILGVTGDVSWAEIEPRLERLLADWGPCAQPLERSPPPDIRTEPGVFLIPRNVEQSVVVMAHTTEVRLGDTQDYFASRIGASILGGGGLSSRLMTRLRTERGLAYGASALWTTPITYPGLVGAVTRVKTERTVEAIELIMNSIGEMTETPPTADEVEHKVAEIVNGFVFNFESPAQIVARQITYRWQRLPNDWLERYLIGVQAVGPDDVRRVFRDHVVPERMVILVVGDPDKMEAPLETLGSVTVHQIPAPADTQPGG